MTELALGWLLLLAPAGEGHSRAFNAPLYQWIEVTRYDSKSACEDALTSLAHDRAMKEQTRTGSTDEKRDVDEYLNRAELECVWKDDSRLQAPTKPPTKPKRPRSTGSGLLRARYT